MRGVLLVDDDPDILDSLRDVLELSLPDVEVYVAASGPEALRVLERSGAEIDLIISDFRMPGMDGAELLARAEPLAPGIPHVLISAFPEAILKAQLAAQVPITRVVPKPLDMDEFIGMTRELLEAA